MASSGASEDIVRTSRHPASPPRPQLLLSCKSAVFHALASREKKKQHLRPQSAAEFQTPPSALPDPQFCLPSSSQTVSQLQLSADLLSQRCSSRPALSSRINSQSSTRLHSQQPFHCPYPGPLTVQHQHSHGSASLLPACLSVPLIKASFAAFPPRVNEAHQSLSASPQLHLDTTTHRLGGGGSGSNGRCQSDIPCKANFKTTKSNCNCGPLEVTSKNKELLLSDSQRTAVFLGKKTFPRQPCTVIPTLSSVSTLNLCSPSPYPQKNPNPSLLETTTAAKSAMPTNQSSPWGSGKLGASPKAASSTTTPIKPTVATRVPSGLQGSVNQDSSKLLLSNSSHPQKQKATEGNVNGNLNYNKTGGDQLTVPFSFSKQQDVTGTQQQNNGIQTEGLKQPGEPRLVERKKGMEQLRAALSDPPSSALELTSELAFHPDITAEVHRSHGQAVASDLSHRSRRSSGAKPSSSSASFCLTFCDPMGASSHHNTRGSHSNTRQASSTTTGRNTQTAATSSQTVGTVSQSKSIPSAVSQSTAGQVNSQERIIQSTNGNTKPTTIDIQAPTVSAVSSQSTFARISQPVVSDSVAACSCPRPVPASPSARVSATETRPAGTETNTVKDVASPSGIASVCSVTSKISAIHLTKKGRSASSSSSCSPPVKDQEPPEVSSQENVEDEQFPAEFENSSDDDGFDCCSIDDTLFTTSLPSVEQPMAEEWKKERPALVPSLFPLRPPTLYFSTAEERVELLPVDQRRLLKWKLSSVTPNIVKQTIARSHFKITKRSHDWLGCWGHHMKSPGFKSIGEHQKLNHFPGSFQIGRKDRLWRNLSRMQTRFGKREFSFFPRSFILPQDMKLLRKAWDDGGRRHTWIIKPPASARGIGIQVIHKWSQMPRKRPLLVQKYLHKPYLISGSKFDLRIYVYVTSYDPLRVYIFSDGLVRFASCKYSSSLKSLSNKFMHLTNYSVNKKNVEYQKNSDNTACQGHKWTLKALWQYLGERGINTDLIWEKIKDIVIKTIIASDPYVNTLVKMNLRSSYSCHELFGFDIMLDQNLKPWVLEVNISPSLHSNTPLDVAVKGQMIRDVLNLAGFLLPLRQEVSSCSSASCSSASCSSSTSSTNSLSGGVRDRSRAELSTDEKVKRAFYLTQRFADQDFYSSVLDILTPEDVRILAESEDELSRKGDFERVFPSAASSRYLRFFECPRYLNILLDQWEQRHWQNRPKGISLLRSLCQKGIHLGTADPAHIWSKCGYISRFEPQREDHHRRSSSSVVVDLQHHSILYDDENEGSDPEVVSVASSGPDVSLSASPSPAGSPCPTPNPSPVPVPSSSQSLPHGHLF